LAAKPAPICISLSHCAGIAVCAVAPHGAALGCDLEVIEVRSEAFVADYFTAEEQALVAQAPASDRPRILALLWSGKESALKALRAGLRLDTRSVLVMPAEEGEECLRDPAEELRVDGWHPLRVHYWHDHVFHGWWQETGSLLRTLVAAPPPVPPMLLHPA
jgi:4'-phosphopantetheinyl transferase